MSYITLSNREWTEFTRPIIIYIIELIVFGKFNHITIGFPPLLNFAGNYSPKSYVNVSKSMKTLNNTGV